VSGDPRAVRQAAFGDRPDLPVRVRPGTAPVERWLVAVALGGQGRYAAAAAELGRLLADPSVPTAVAAHAAITRAAHRRQQGGHAAARPDDALGLRLALAAGGRGDPTVDGTDARAARIDALVGLAADAVGLGAAAVAVRLLDRADREAEDHPSWRPAVRTGWVRAEVALLRGRADEAVPPAERALAGARVAGSARHVLKSRLVLVVARGAAGVLAPADAVEELDAIGTGCARLRQLPLEWPCALAAADLLDALAARERDERPGANDVTARTGQRCPDGRANGATRRRHAAALTMSVIGDRSDPVGKRLSGVSL
jgi:hypothetical protein